MSEWFNGGNEERTATFMFTRHSGVELLNFTPADVDTDDIAHALGMQCRFNGHTKEFYSVAQHCVLVAELLSRRGASVKLQLYGLLHDAGEAYVGDVTVPVQNAAGTAAFGTAAKELEDDILDQIMYAVLGKERGLTPAEAEALHQADKDMGRVEIRDLIEHSFGMVDFSDLADEGQILWCARPEDARELWLCKLRHLTEALEAQ